MAFPCLFYYFFTSTPQVSLMIFIALRQLPLGTTQLLVCLFQSLCLFPKRAGRLFFSFFTSALYISFVGLIALLKYFRHARISCGFLVCNCFLYFAIEMLTECSIQREFIATFGTGNRRLRHADSK